MPSPNVTGTTHIDTDIDGNYDNCLCTAMEISYKTHWLAGSALAKYNNKQSSPCGDIEKHIAFVVEIFFIFRTTIMIVIVARLFCSFFRHRGDLHSSQSQTSVY